MESQNRALPARIGRFRVTRKLGEGGMGVVYAAEDDQLGRSVAIKMIRESKQDPRARERLWREARAAASLTHPNICCLYEVGEDGGELFLAMELVEGESLASRLSGGALPFGEAVQTALQMLSALTALHARRIVHRDLKPSNVFLTPHGVKLLDFGLARPIRGANDRTETGLTAPWQVVGTPQYMAPEQLEGRQVDARSDIFAAGIILFELLTGRPPFTGDSVVRVFHAITYEQPPVLGGSAAIAEVDRVIHRALAKRPQDRYQSTEAMAEDLRMALVAGGSGESPRAHAVVRLIVLPLKVPRSDEEVDFLAFSLPDAITNALSGLESVIVRSSMTAARYAGDTPDLKRLASEAEVDLVLTGSLLRAGDQVRVSAQLIEAPGGTVVWSNTSQAPLRDLFQLQDSLTQRIVQSLSVPLSAREHRALQQNVPATARAYECYLRANQLAYDTKDWSVARDLYRQCVNEDPEYAPGWARLGRMHYVLAKYGDRPEENEQRAEDAFKRALEIDPDLSVAHHLYARLEVESGRAQAAMLRLLARTTGQTADPEAFGALVHPCRYCGLLDASLAAHERACRFDPSVRTSVGYTHLMLGDYARALEVHEGDVWLQAYALSASGRTREAITLVGAEEERTNLPLRRSRLKACRFALEGDREKTARALEDVSIRWRDPEGLFFMARFAAYAGVVDQALEMLSRAVDGFFCYSALVRDQWFDGLRTQPAFLDIVQRAEKRYREARVAFLEAGGDRVLGPPASVART